MRERNAEGRERIPDVRERVPDEEIGRADLRRAGDMFVSSGDDGFHALPRDLSRSGSNSADLI